MLSGKDLQIRLVKVDSRNESFYTSIYGSLKYYVSGDKTTGYTHEDKTIAFIDNLSGMKSTTMNESTFVKELRRNVVTKIKSGDYDNLGTYTLFNKLKRSFYSINDDTGEEIFSKVPKPQLREFKTWLEDSPYEVQYAFQNFERDYVNPNPRDQKDFFNIDIEHDLEIAFNEKLANVIDSKPTSFETDISIIQSVLDAIGIDYKEIDDIDDLPAITIDEMTSEKAIVLLKDPATNYYKYLTVLNEAGNNENYGKTAVDAFLDEEALNTKDEFVEFGSEQVVDTVDYFKLGSNRYKQYLDKYNYEQEIYTNQRNADSDFNLSTTMENKLNVIKQIMQSNMDEINLGNYYLKEMIESTFSENIDTIGDIMIQKDRIISDIITHNNDILSGEFKIAARSIKFKMDSITTDIKFHMDKYGKMSAYDRDQSTAKISTSIKELLMNTGKLMEDVNKSSIGGMQKIVNSIFRLDEQLQGITTHLFKLQEGLEKDLNEIIRSLGVLATNNYENIRTVSTWTQANFQPIGYVSGLSLTPPGPSQPITFVKHVAPTKPPRAKYVPITDCPDFSADDEMFKWYDRFFKI